MIITVASNRVGAGKSTIAINIATLRTLVGRRVLLIDLDPKKSICRWSEARNGANIQPKIPACSIKGKHLRTEFERFTSRYNDVLIDTDWRNTTGKQTALEISDMVVVPIEVSDKGLVELKQMIRNIKAARRTNPDLWALVVIARAQDELRIGELDKIRNYVEKLPSTALAGTMIRERASLQQALSEGLSIFEYKPADACAIAEMHDLYRAQKMRRSGVPSLWRLLKHRVGQQ
jgi:chromosome partitioning protein